MACVECVESENTARCIGCGAETCVHVNYLHDDCYADDSYLDDLEDNFNDDLGDIIQIELD